MSGAAGREADPRRRVRRVLGAAAAALLVAFALLAPSDIDHVTPSAFVRVPGEAVVGLAALLVLPTRAGRAVAVVGGAALGLLAVVKIMDLGFDAVLGRPFDLVLDWPLLAPAVDYLWVTSGPASAIGAVAAAVLVAVGLPAAVTLAVVRLSRVAARHQLAATRTVAVLAVGWIVCAGTPPASGGAVDFALGHARQVRDGLLDGRAFAEETAADPFRDRGDLLRALRGKDVLIVFVESYGRDAVADPELAGGIRAALDDGAARLAAAGYDARSAFLTSPTSGGGSWLAQASLLSGVRVDNQQRYRTLLAGDRLTLSGAFRRAGWRTVGVVPGITRAWPEGAFFGYDAVHTADGLGYRGPRFSYATMPDQHTLAAFQRLERARDHDPVMAVIPLVGSHAPWTPVPDLVDWADVGDGSVFAAAHTGDRPAEAIFGGDPAAVRADYRRAVECSVRTLVSYVQTYGDDDLVMVFLGDHQPAAVVVGDDASHDVPVSIIARDPAVVDRVATWRWDHGLAPGAHAPVWPMEAFRDRFLSTFDS